jgi:hypothetical protein
MPGTPPPFRIRADRHAPRRPQWRALPADRGGSSERHRRCGVPDPGREPGEAPGLPRARAVSRTWRRADVREGRTSGSWGAEPRANGSTSPAYVRSRRPISCRPGRRPSPSPKWTGRACGLRYGAEAVRMSCGHAKHKNAGVYASRATDLAMFVDGKLSALAGLRPRHHQDHGNLRARAYRRAISPQSSRRPACRKVVPPRSATCVDYIGTRRLGRRVQKTIEKNNVRGLTVAAKA